MNPTSTSGTLYVVDTMHGWVALCCSQVNYKNVMKEYGLGPNGGILTSLNLFTTKFDQVIKATKRPW